MTPGSKVGEGVVSGNKVGVGVAVAFGAVVGVGVDVADEVIFREIVFRLAGSITV